jgi:hypothetical protein
MEEGCLEGPPCRKRTAYTHARMHKCRSTPTHTHTCRQVCGGEGGRGGSRCAGPRGREGKKVEEKRTCTLTLCLFEDLGCGVQG